MDVNHPGLQQGGLGGPWYSACSLVKPDPHTHGEGQESSLYYIRICSAATMSAAPIRLQNKRLLLYHFEPRPSSVELCCINIFMNANEFLRNKSVYHGLQVICQQTELENLKMTNQNWGDVICDGSNWSVLNYNYAFADEGLANHGIGLTPDPPWRMWGSGFARLFSLGG